MKHSSLSDVYHLLVSVALLLVYPVLLPGQTNKTPPPPPPRAAPAARPAPPPPQQRPAASPPQQRSAPPQQRTVTKAPTLPPKPPSQQTKQLKQNYQPSNTKAEEKNKRVENKNFEEKNKRGKNKTVEEKHKRVEDENVTTSPGVPGRHSDGSRTVATKSGDKLDYDKGGRLNAVTTHSGTQAQFGPNNRVAIIKTNRGLSISHRPNGQRIIERHDAQGNLQSRVVSTGPNRGYVERNYQRNGHNYMRRTYVSGGRAYAHVYRQYSSGGAVYYQYVPDYYFGPAFYDWAYGPWTTPVYWTWPGGDPLAYASPALWMTDYVLAHSAQVDSEQPPVSGNLDGQWLAYYPGGPLQVNIRNMRGQVVAILLTGNAFVPAGKVTFVGKYRSNSFPARQICAGLNYTNPYWAPATIEIVDDNHLTENSAGSPSCSGFPVLWERQSGPEPDPNMPPPERANPAPPEVKQEFAGQIKYEIVKEKSASLSGKDEKTDDVQPVIDPNIQVFIVASSLDVVTEKGQACSLNSGDILTRIDDIPGSDKKVQVKVTSSQKSDCAVGSKPRVLVADLQDMHNQFLEHMDQGFKTLSGNQSKVGLPAGLARAGHINSEGVAQTQDATEVVKSQREADDAEKEVQQTITALPSAGEQQ